MKREFEHFNDTDRCPICKTGDDKPCILVPIDGTNDGNICQGIAVHVDCIELRFNRNVGVLYQKVQP